MNIGNVCKRSFKLVANQWALWLFGALLALTTINGIYFGWNPDREGDYRGEGITIHLGEDRYLVFPGNGLNIDLDTPQGVTFTFDQDNIQQEFDGLGVLLREVIPTEIRYLFYAVILWVAVLFVTGLFLRYTSETAVIRMTNRHEENGEPLGVRQGLRYGWSRLAGRLFLIDLLVYGTVFVLFTMVFLLALSPLALLFSGDTQAGIAGFLASMGLLFLGVSLAVIVGIALSLLVQLFHRACAVENLGVFASIQRGFTMLAAHFKDFVLVWIVWIGVRLFWMVAMVPVMVLLFPLTLLFIFLGALLAGLPTLMIGGLLSLGIQGVVPWIIAGLFNLPVLVVVTLAPLLFLSGLVEVFKANLWTLAYRDLQVIEKAAVNPLPGSPFPEFETIGTA